MDGLFHGKPYEQMDDLGGPIAIFGNTHLQVRFFSTHSKILARLDCGSPHTVGMGDFWYIYI